MPFDPTLPANGAPIVAAELRSQLTGLQALIPAGLTSAQVDSTNSTSPGNPATASVSLAGTVLHFDFTIPEGQQGQPGEVTQSQLSNDLSNTANSIFNTIMPLTSNNSNGVGTLGQSADSNYQQSQMQDVMNKLDELINALRR